MRNNGLKANPNKFHLILSETDDHYSVNVDKFKIVNSKSKKLLGVKIDSKMTFNDHVSGICTKASQNFVFWTKSVVYVCRIISRTLISMENQIQPI